MPIKYTRVHRLLEIISLVQSQRGWNAKTLAERCDTTERNIYRDINQIKEAGIPILEPVEVDDKFEKNIKNLIKKDGFPLLIKSSAGGGGKGMKKVYSLE
ncbi:MAG: HTH domain-containing protein, partial [Phycisphaerae bacterium]|nr:HTH domain-containing protein [Phycisphaerae bacterium]